MDRKEKDFDVMKWLRGVRDKHYELFKDRPAEERLAYYREQSRKLMKERGLEPKREEKV